MRYFSAVILMFSSLVFSIRAQDDFQITLPESIIAGQAFEVIINLNNPVETIDILLLAGLQQHHAVIEVNDVESESILFEADTVTITGTAILFVTIDDDIYTRTLQILADEPAQIDLFATGNAISAYGEEESQLISFLYDAYGSPIHDHVLTFSSQSPDGQLTQNNTVATQYGRATAIISSLRNPGLLNVAVDANQLSQTLQIIQFPTEPSTITLTVNPECLLIGRSETIYLEARIVDLHGFAVRDGTQVIFQWDAGFAFGTSLHGVASVSLPPFEAIGNYDFTVEAGNASDSVRFQIMEDTCP